MTPLPCPHCGAVDVPRLGPGRGPHAAAVCPHCGTWLKWLRKEKTPVSVNRCILIGTISKYGVEVRYAPSGTACASLALVLVDVGQDGKEHLTLVPCELLGPRQGTTTGPVAGTGALDGA